MRIGGYLGIVLEKIVAATAKKRDQVYCRPVKIFGNLTIGVPNDDSYLIVDSVRDLHFVIQIAPTDVEHTGSRKRQLRCQ
ncbi:MAG: hypothetical protein CMJ46_04085 [Planctomyces sp.]|nr:hypothetical protein [Planctomyces sp.]